MSADWATGTDPSTVDWTTTDSGGGGGGDCTTCELGDLANVDVAGVSDGEVLTFDQASGDWIAAPGGGSLALDDLTDVDAAAPNDGQVLTFDNGTGDWIAADPSPSPTGLSHGETVVNGDVAANSATWATMTGYEVTIDAAAGDLVDLMLACYPNAFSGGGSGQLALDIGTVVSAAVVNRISGGTGNSDHGCLEGFAVSSVRGAGIARRYLVQAGDVSGGTVTFRGLYRNPVGSCTITATANFRSLIQATNLGPAA